MPAPILLGQSDFVSLRARGSFYLDKSAIIAEVLSAPAEVLLYPRPRRFGKTLNMSTLQAFFEIGEDRSALFSDLKVWQDDRARPHFQRYPVIYLTFKDIKQGTWEGALGVIIAALSSEVGRHRSVLADERVPVEVRERLEAVRAGLGGRQEMLRDLCQALSIHHGQPAIILIDEYDAGILTAWEKGYYDEAADFFRSFLSPGLKDNPFLFKGVLTGILRVAKESMFSGLNNVIVYSLLHDRELEPFGFTEGEVGELLIEFGRSAEEPEFRRWYNGYTFGRTTVYNPWSVLNALAHGGRLQNYWLNTSDNALVRTLLIGAVELGEDIRVLLTGGTVERRISEDVPLRDLRGGHVWSLLLFAGYLTTTAVRIENNRIWATLRLPNREVATLWEDTFLEWIERYAGPIEPLHHAFLSGDGVRVQGILSEMLLRHTSTHDVAQTQSEAFYHAFVLGMLVTLEKTHSVRSNRESGLGRADVLLIPKGESGTGVVMEFKKQTGKKTLATCAREALKQVQEQAYTAELEAAGASVIRRFGISFAGKDVVVRAG